MLAGKLLPGGQVVKKAGLQMRRVGGRGILGIITLVMLFHRALALPQHEQDSAIFRVLVGHKFDDSPLALESKIDPSLQ